jgi:hypothetical protein
MISTGLKRIGGNKGICVHRALDLILDLIPHWSS